MIDDNNNGNGRVALLGSDVNYGERGSDLGHAGVEQMDDRAGRICSTERQRIEATNRPKIAAATEELAAVDRDLESASKEVSSLPPEGGLRVRRTKAFFLFAFSIVLCIGGFVSALFGLEPFMPDWKKYFLAGAIAGILPFAVHFVICEFRSDRFRRWLAAGDLAFALVAMSSLAVIRARVFAEQMRQGSAAVVIDGDAPVSPPQASTFFQDTAWLMMVFSVFTAIAMEIAAGLAFHAACRLWEEMPSNASEIRKRHADLINRRIELVHRIEVLEQEPETFVNHFWRNYHEAQLRGCMNNRFTKMFSILFLSLMLFGSIPRAHAEDRLNLVVGLDLTSSVADARGLDRKTELERDESAITKLLASIPAGVQITVIGITDHSFSQPYVLLSARVDDNEGYFHERIANARRELVAAWQRRSKDLLSRFPQTDLFGALVVSSQLLQPRPGLHNVLILFSDMRHETRALNLACCPTVSADATLKRVEASQLVASLKGVEVYALGVDGAGESIAYWDSLRAFWLAYFQHSGATVKAYSMLRDLPDLSK